MEDLILVEHAFKHGLSEKDIACAWQNYLVRQYRGAPHEGEVVAVGCDAHGRLIEMVAAERSFGTVLFHAKHPPTEKVLRELGLTRRRL